MARRAEQTDRLRQWEFIAEANHWSSGKMAELCRLSTRQFRRLFRLCNGASPRHLLAVNKLLAAERYLAAGKSLKETSFLLGFKKVGNFCRMFRRMTGMTPSQFVAVAAPQDYEI